MIGRLIHALCALATVVAILLWITRGESGLVLMAAVVAGVLTFLTRGWAER
jgi:hypothetical protein